MTFRRSGRRPGKAFDDHLEYQMAGANTVLLNDWFDSGCPTQRPSGALSSNNEGRSAAPSARSDGLDDVDGGPDGAVYIQVGGIEQDGVLGLL
jgi:hypothetical protein